MNFLSQVEKMHHSANVVKNIGDFRGNNKVSLREYLTIDGVGLWEIIEPTLAAFEYPRVLDCENKLPRLLKYEFRSYFSNLKYKRSRIKDVKYSKLINCDTPLRFNDVSALLYGYSGYMERDVIKPLSIGLDNNNIKYYILFDNLTSKTSEADEINNRINVWCFWDDECQKNIKIFKEKYMELIKNVNSLYLFELRNCNFFGSNIAFKAFFRYVLNVLLPNYFYYVILAQKIFNKLKVAWNISPDVSDPKIRAFCLVGKQKKVQWADIQFGIYGEEAVEWRFCLSDYVAVWGQSFYEIFKNFGIPERNIHITGSPKFDLLDPLCHKPEVKVKKDVNILFCSMYFLNAYSNIPGYARALSAIKHDIVKYTALNADVNLTIKLHPLEDSAELSNIVNGLSNVRLIRGADDIRKYIPSCDVFVTLGSTSTMDAILLGKPVIYPNYDGLVWWDDIYLKSSVVIQTSSPDLLKDMLCNPEKIFSVYQSENMKYDRARFINKWLGFKGEESAMKILKGTGLLQ